MDDSFDPYYTWLGIRPEEQPPDYYRLIGLRQFEDNADVISNAADRQMQFLRSMQVGKRSALSQKLLNEISAAGGCLLDPQRKAKYDQELRAKENAKAQAAKAAAAKARPIPKAAPLAPAPKPVSGLVPIPMPQNDPFAMPMSSGPAMPAYGAPVVTANKPEPAQKINWQSPANLAGAGGIGLLLIVIALVGWMMSGGSTNTAQNTNPGKAPVTAVPSQVPASAPNTPANSIPKPSEVVKSGPENPPVVGSKEIPPTEIPVPPATPVVKAEKPVKSNWEPPSSNSPRAFRTMLGNYMYWNDLAKTYPIVNVQIPHKNLWTPEIQDKVRGKVPYDEISYVGTARIAVPADGIYFLDTEKAARVQIDGKVVADWDTPKGEIKIAGGIHEFTFEIGSHGGNWMRDTNLALRQKETGEEVAFFNTWQDIQKFLATSIGGQQVTEVSGWQPTEENEIKEYAQLLASAGVKQPSVPVVKAGPALPTPVHSWSFDEKSGDTVADSGKGDSQGKNPVHLAGWNADQPRFVPGKMGNALRFSQQEQFAAAERYVDYPQFTMSFWLKVLGEEGINPRIAHPWIELNYEHRAGVGVLGLVIEPNRPEVGKWYHYAVAVDQTKRQVTIFRDGAEVARGMLGDYESRSNVKYWAFGHNQDQSNPNDSIHGELDEVKLYDRMLTSAEAKQLAATELAQSLAPAGSVATGSPTALHAAAKKAIPDAAAQEAALTKVSSVFVDEWKGAKTAPLKQKLAKNLLEVAATTVEVSERFVLLAEARRLAVEAKDVPLATLALDTLGNDFEIDLLAEKVKLLQGLNLGTTTPAQRSAILTAVCEAGHEALDAENLESVNALAVLARSLAAKNATADGKAAVKQFTESAGQWQKRMEALRKAEQTLVATPDNPAANLLVGLHSFFVRGKQQAGLAMLAKGSDPHLASAAKARMDNIVKGVASSFAEADDWYDAIATAGPDYKAPIQRQALECYTLLASSTTGLDKAKATTHRDQLAKEVAAAPDPAVKRLRMQDLPESTPGLVGRVFVNDKDAGILLTHRPPGEMKPQAIAHILTLTKATGFRMVLVGTIHCPAPCICHVFQTGKNRGPAQEVMIGGKLVSAVGGMNRRDSDERFPLAAGDHVVQWTVDCDGTNAPRIDLYLNLGDESKPIMPHFTRAQAFDARKLPVTKEVDVSAFGPDPQ